MTLTRRALLAQALVAPAASARARARATPPPGKPAGVRSGAPAWIEADLPAAERLLALAYTPAQRMQLARTYTPVLKKLAGVRALDLVNDVSPACRFDPRIPGKSYPMPTRGIRGAVPAAGPFPTSPVGIALAPAWRQATWLREKKISSLELTHLYLDRIRRGLALEIINGLDPRDWGSIDAPLGWDWQARARRLRVGYVPAWFESNKATAVDNHALDALRETGAQVVEVRMPDLPYGLLTPLVFIEAAAAFSQLTLTHRDDELKSQADMAWPNTWRRAHLFPAVEMVQIERLRREVMVGLDGLFDGIDALIGPVSGDDSLVATNATGNPCLAMKAGFLELPTRRVDDKPISMHAPKHRVPRAICLWSALFREDVLITLGRALEAVLGVADQNPPLALR